MAKTSVDIPQLKFNKMSTAKYEELKLAGQLNNNEFYITPDGGTIPEVNETTNDFVLSNNGTDLNWVQETEYTKNRIDSKLDDNVRTNCITKIPQDIKLELNNGTLTLKAGSKVYVPNGFEADETTPKFDEITITAGDIINTTVGAGEKMFLSVYNNGAYLFAGYTIGETVTERPVSPIQYALYYNTTTNKVEFYDGSSWVSSCSFPISLYTRGSTGATSIDQVFNGFGYIGSTVFALPGIEGLIPNGRNDDGSLNNTKFKTTSVLTRTMPSVTNQHRITLKNDTLLYIDDISYGYNEEENVNYDKSTGHVFYYMVAGLFSTVNGRITAFNPKTVFQAVDRNEADYVVESYKNGSNWYRIYKSGWIEQGGIITVNGASTTTISLLKAYKDTLYSVTHALKTVISRYDPAITNTSIDSFTITYPSAGGDAIVSWEAKGQGE